MESLKKAASEPIPWYACLGFELVERALAKPSKIVVAENLRLFLDKAGMSNAELGRRVGVTRAAVGRWIDAKSEPSLDMLDKIGKVLGVPTIAFFEDPSDPRSAGRFTGMTGETALRVIAEIVKSREFKKD